MSKVTVALVSFVAGISSTLLFSMLSGNQRSISAQEPEPGPAMIIVGAEPKVPPLAGVHFNGQVTTTGGVMPLDGIDCEGCTFSGPLFSYAGGAVRLTNPKFSGPVRVNFKG